MKVQPHGGGCRIEMTSLAPALLAAALGLPAAAHADACAIEVRGALDAEWSAATASVAELALTDRDCLRVQIDVAGAGARVLFTTPDGRSAERIVGSPAELRPTIDALRVRGPAAPAPPPAESEPAQAAPAESQVEEDSSQGAADSSGLRVALLAGLRGGPESLLSPLLMAELSFSVSLVELGASLAAEVQYFDMTGTRSPSRQGSAAAFGVHAGARAPWSSFDLRAGARVAYAPLLTVNNDTQACEVGTSCPFPMHDERVDEWRVGVYAGIAVPRDSALRFRAELSGDMVTPAAGASELAITPPWALAAQLGLEVEP